MNKLYLQKWRWYERNSLPWNRLAIHNEFANRNAFVRWPVQGNVLESFRDGRLDVLLRQRPDDPGLGWAWRAGASMHRGRTIFVRCRCVTGRPGGGFDSSAAAAP